MLSILGLLNFWIPLNVTAFRVIRGTRILRIFKSLHELADLLKTLYSSIKSFACIMILSLLILFVFTLMAMRLFSNIEKGAYGKIGD